jgi:hypothetical protein
MHYNEGNSWALAGEVDATASAFWHPVYQSGTGAFLYWTGSPYYGTKQVPAFLFILVPERLDGRKSDIPALKKRVHPARPAGDRKGTHPARPCHGKTLHIHTLGSGNGYTQHIYSVGCGKGTLHIPTDVGGKGYAHARPNCCLWKWLHPAHLYCWLDMYGKQEQELLLEVPTTQRPEMYMDLSTHRGLSCTWTCLETGDVTGPDLSRLQLLAFAAL